MADQGNPTSAHVHGFVQALENVILPIINAYVPGLGKSTAGGGNLEKEATQLVSAMESCIGALIRPQVAQFMQTTPAETRNEKATGMQARFGKFLTAKAAPALDRALSLKAGPALNRALSNAAPALDRVLSLKAAPALDHALSLPIAQVAHFKKHAAELPVPMLEHRTQSLSGIQISKKQGTSGRSLLLDRALQKLRKRVNNEMPIRLMAFKPDGSDMELVERSTILVRLTSAMESEFDDAKIQSEINRVKKLGAESNGSAQAYFEGLAIDSLISQYTKYAILSHTWQDNEVSYRAWKTGEVDEDSGGYLKLANFCRVAAMDYGATYGWMDTLCINKDSSAELDESIRSMYKWYHDASVCIAFLAETTDLQHMRSDRWFTRGWTLQELLAPKVIVFYGADWQKLGANLREDEKNRAIEREIEAATTISPADFKTFKTDRHSIPISRRMRWAANREVTRDEDTAYSLMGIFDVGVPISYGEGSDRAFTRLVREILNLSGSSGLDILNWGSGSNAEHDGASAISSMIPSRPQQYLWRTDADIHWPPPMIPSTLTHLGLHVSVLLMPAISTSSSLLSQVWFPIGQYHGTAHVKVRSIDGIPENYNLMDKSVWLKPSGWDKSSNRFHMVFGVMNFIETSDSIELQESSSFALCFTFKGTFLGLLGDMKREKLTKLSTINPPEIHLKRQITAINWSIQKSALQVHGMQLLNLYL